MVGPEANIVSACVAYGTEGVEARSVMDEPRANVDWLSPVWSTRGEGLLQPEIGLDAKHNTVLSSGEEGEDFFLDIPSYRTHRELTHPGIMRRSPDHQDDKAFAHCLENTGGGISDVILLRMGQQA
jgi:hypothetical protein